MSLSHKHKKLSFLNIHIQYGKETVSFNLLEELTINPDNINRELTKQPGNYGFVLLLHKKLLTRFEELKTRRTKIRGKLFLKAKAMNQPGTQRPMTEDMAWAWVESHKEFVDISQKCIKAKDDADTIYSCVKSFEQKMGLTQTISSNLRNEK